MWKPDQRLAAAIVTGASSGIGRATAIACAQKGVNLVLTARREPELASVADEARAIGVDAQIVVGDVGRPELPQSLISAVREMAPHAPIGLVHNAGSAAFGPFEEMDPAALDAMMEVMLLAPIRLTRALLPTMLETGGRIVGVSSIATRAALAQTACYTSAKSGLEAFIRTLNLETRRRGVFASIVVPGATFTPLWGSGGPPSEDMLSADVVGQAIADLLVMPPDRHIDELVLTPPKGVL